ncbi:MAG: hypothetical protein KME59_23005 [Trichormus sp. ATA11-4-KO1]|jgi:hypothetical protein|nr:hypothetical protein [Trichormus sp. ATA11-4-KO1]
MVSKKYSQKYRQLKTKYENICKKQISDISWYRLISQLRNYLDFDIESPKSSKIIHHIATLKRTHRNFRINSENFAESWQLFQHYYQQKTELTCAEFLAELAQKLDLNQVSKTSIYNWFTNAGIPYKAEKKYKSSDLALVAFQAAKCLNSRELKRVENAVITIDSLAVSK